MNFASDEFLVFLPLAFLLYWGVGSGSVTRQNVILLIASYIFYAAWDPRFLSLLIATSAGDYWIGKRLSSDDDLARRRFWLGLSVVGNLGVLGFFKYWNFFIQSAASGLQVLGLRSNLPMLNVILPIGISFYIFHTLGYVCDIYRGKAQPAKGPLEFFLFVAFFPQLVAGPISRADSMLGQFQQPRSFDYCYATGGFRIMLWGFFKKLVIADNCGPLVDLVWKSTQAQGASVWLAALLFSLQIYADFSGYSDIAVGCARLFGFQLNWNFRLPYFSQNPREFWRRWHITLSQCFRDFVYIPLGGNRSNLSRSLLLTFVLSGLWHGANWTFLFWGALHGIGYLCWRGNSRPLTFLWITFCWVFFRAPNLPAAADFLRRACVWDLDISNLTSTDQLLCLVVGSIILIGLEALNFRAGEGAEAEYPLQFFGNGSTAQRWIGYLIFVSLIYIFGNLRSDYDFIYFQF